MTGYKPTTVEDVAEDMGDRLSAFKNDYKQIHEVVSVDDLKSWRSALMESDDYDGDAPERIGQAIEVANLDGHDVADAVSAKQIWSWFKAVKAC